MSQENVDALHEGYEAFARGDLDGAFESFADDIVWRSIGDSIPGGGTFNGIDEIKTRWLPEFAANYQDFSQSVDQTLDCGDYVIALGTSSATVAGQKVDESFCHVWRYSGDKIVEAIFFGDTAATYKALEAAKAAV
jgi:ketosteroid isomerase-like protein